MRKSIIGILTVALLLLATSGKSQSLKDLQINEVLITNTDNYVDNFGNRSAWIEIMNLGFYKVNIANYYLTNDINNPKMYRIPANDPITNIAQRHFLLFFASGEGSGTQYLNFELDSTHRFIALFSSDGKTLVDSITIPMVAPNVSYCRFPDGNGKWGIAEQTTPLGKNDTHSQKVSSNEKFSAVDPYGIIMAITAMTVVFTALFVLYRLFRLIGNINQGKFKRKPKGVDVENSPKVNVNEVSGEVFAAISMALYQHEEDSHDQESEILTIEKISRRYSPWSSKFFNLRQMPDVRRNRR